MTESGYSNYIQSETGTLSTETNGWLITSNSAINITSGSRIDIKTNGQGNKYHADLIFRLLKKKGCHTILGRNRYNRRIHKLKKLAEQTLKSKHFGMNKKFLAKLQEETILSEVGLMGVKLFIRKGFVNKYKNKVKGGHISDTALSKYTNPIPKDVLHKINHCKKFDIFSEYVVYHYYSKKLEEKKEKKEKISPEEKSAMRDPIVFGIVKELPDHLFFIADWEDDYCSLTFDELVDDLKIDDEEVEIKKDPVI